MTSLKRTIIDTCESGDMLTFGLSKSGQLTHISEVSSGLACDCVCPSCKVTLVAKKGKINSHSFSHNESNICIGAIETALHLAAKKS